MDLGTHEFLAYGKRVCGFYLQRPKAPPPLPHTDSLQKIRAKGFFIRSRKHHSLEIKR